MTTEELMKEYKKISVLFPSSDPQILKLQQLISKLNLQVNELKQNVNELEQNVEILKGNNNTLQKDKNNLQIEVNYLTRQLFGTKRERSPQINPNQLSLFEKVEDIEEDLKNQEEQQLEKKVVKDHKGTKRRERNAGIRKSYVKNLPINRKEFVLNPEENHCTQCGRELKIIGKKLMKQEIEYIPAHLEITNYVANVYKCKQCGTKESEEENVEIATAKVPRAFLSHTFASASLATEIIFNKYYMGTPLYRQEKMWYDKGLVLPRSVMANWCIKINEEYLEPLKELMLKKIKATNKLVHMDESSVQCNKEPERAAQTKSYMWELRSGVLEEIKGVVFKYSPSRSAKIAEELLQGFKGTVVTDGYAGYNNIPDITHAECWSHARRYFYDSVPLLENKKMNTNTESYKGVEYCDKLFKIEKEIASLSVPEKQQVRQERSKPIVKEFFDWVNNILETKVIGNEKLLKALTYASNQQKELSEFLNDRSHSCR